MRSYNTVRVLFILLFFLARGRGERSRLCCTKNCYFFHFLILCFGKLHRWDVRISNTCTYVVHAYTYGTYVRTYLPTYLPTKSINIKPFERRYISGVLFLTFFDDIFYLYVGISLFTSFLFILEDTTISDFTFSATPCRAP